MFVRVQVRMQESVCRILIRFLGSTIQCVCMRLFVCVCMLWGLTERKERDSLKGRKPLEGDRYPPCQRS